jgi:DNA-binding NtrC family response regulator
VPAPTDAATAKPGVVLVVEDDDVVREVAQIVLEIANYQVITAFDGQDGVEVFARRAAEIGAVLLDLTMPRLSGEEALRQIREIRADVPVVLTSGYDEGGRYAAFPRGDRIAFLPKPYTPDGLVACLREVCSR